MGLMKRSQRKYLRGKLETCSHLQHMCSTTGGYVCEMEDNKRTINLIVFELHINSSWVLSDNFTLIEVVPDVLPAL